MRSLQLSPTSLDQHTGRFPLARTLEKLYQICYQSLYLLSLPNADHDQTERRRVRLERAHAWSSMLAQGFACAPRPRVAHRARTAQPHDRTIYVQLCPS